MKKKAIFIYLFLVLISIGTFLGLGYWYSKSGLQYDFVIVDKPVGNLNYNTGAGSNWKPATLMIEGVVGTTVSFENLNKEIKEELTNGNYEDQVSNSDWNSASDVWESAAKAVIKKYSELYDSLGANDFFKSDEFNALEDNEKAILTLALEGGDVGYEKALNILVHYRPFHYSGDDSDEYSSLNTSGINYISTSPDQLYFDQIAFGNSSSIETDSEYKHFKVIIRKGTKWDDGEYVRAEDFAFGISRQLSVKFASQAGYMITEIAGIDGMKEALEWDYIHYDDDGEYTHPEYENFDDSLRWDVSEYETDAEKAIYYGLMPGFGGDTGDGVRGIITNEKDSSKGISWYDEDDKNSNSYIEFNLSAGSQTFATQLNSSGYLPIDADWFWNRYDSESKKSMSVLGINKNSFKSNAAHKLDKFDSQWGFTFSKNDNYWDSDIIESGTGAYRFMSEAATQLAMFKSDQSSFIYSSDSVNKQLAEDEEVNKWVKTKFGQPTTKYEAFNLKKTRTTEAAKFVNDPNFRKAIMHTFDKNFYHEITGLNSTQPTSIFTPTRMRVDSSGEDFVDVANKTTYTTEIGSSGETVDTQLEQISIEERTGAMDGTTPIEPDEWYDIDLAEKYWDAFLVDMEILETEVPDVITLKLLTTSGDKDPFFQTFNAGIQETDFGDRVKIEIVTATTGDFFTQWRDATHFDMASVQWFPDYLDIWSMLANFNAHDPNRSMNGTTEWTFFDGSDYAIRDEDYGEDKVELAKELFNDGASSVFDGTSKITNVETEDGPLDLENALDEISTAAISDNGGKQDAKTWFELGNPNRTELTSGLARDEHLSELSEQEWTNVYLAFEILLKDSGVIIVGNNETPSIDPSKLILEGDPTIGYNRFETAVDVTNIGKDSYWYIVKDRMEELFTPN